MTYIVLQPHSNTNSSAKFRVVDDRNWIRYVNGASNSYAIAGERDDYDDALSLRDQLNEMKTE